MIFCQLFWWEVQQGFFRISVILIRKKDQSFTQFVLHDRQKNHNFVYDVTNRMCENKIRPLGHRNVVADKNLGDGATF